MALVFKTDNAASYLKGLFDTPTDTTSVGYLYKHSNMVVETIDWL